MARAPACWETVTLRPAPTPLLPPLPVPAAAAVEKGGFVWVFYGSKDLPEDERPPIPYVPELVRPPPARLPARPPPCLLT